jgi:CheY-like chemotaxis protein/hemerythrin-like domain-containing protein
MRHPSLISLSQEHHHGLVLALRLCQGETTLSTERWTQDPQGQVERVIHFHRERLTPHFAAEEEVLFPLVRAALPQQGELIDRLLSEHRLLGSQIARLPQISSSDLRKSLAGVGQLLQDHIRAEERVLFPACEAGCTAEALADLGVRLAGLRQNEERAHAAAGMPKPTILLVEDERELRNLFALLLAAEDLEVLQAGSGHEAVRLLNERGQEIRLVVTDMNLPGPGGTFIVSHARRVAPASKILAMSGYAGADMQRAAAEAGADEFINKPFDPLKAVKTVKRLLGTP